MSSGSNESWDHPRSRGVYLFSSSAVGAFLGSSPLARGLRQRLSCRLKGVRIIPARAGFTAAMCRRRQPARDHPRSRGVYCEGREGLGHVSGSSPLARGLLLVRPVRQPHRRIIPARAGFTRSDRARRRGCGDHPRSRGVYCRLVRRRRGFGRIIPARAGFTTPYPAICNSIRDHPRSRGVYLHALGGSAVLDGSSPLARGLHLETQSNLVPTRIIPARAGFTAFLVSFCREVKDHPRSRGVYYVL